MGYPMVFVPSKSVQALWCKRSVIAHVHMDPLDPPPLSRASEVSFLQSPNHDESNDGSFMCVAARWPALQPGEKTVFPG